MTVLPDINTVGVLGDDKQGWLQTLSGRKVSVYNPDPTTISFDDIVNSLTKQCRFNGHCKIFYSVAEHTVRGVDMIRTIYPTNTSLQRSFLVHDFTEGYVGDVIRPIKRFLPEFKVIEAGFHEAIARAFNISDYNEEGVYEIDNFMVMWEKRDLLPSDIEWPGMPNIDHLKLPKLMPMPTDKVIQRMYELKRELLDAND